MKDVFEKIIPALHHEPIFVELMMNKRNHHLSCHERTR